MKNMIKAISAALSAVMIIGNMPSAFAANAGKTGVIYESESLDPPYRGVLNGSKAKPNVAVSGYSAASGTITTEFDLTMNILDYSYRMQLQENTGPEFQFTAASVNETAIPDSFSSNQINMQIPFTGYDPSANTHHVKIEVAVDDDGKIRSNSVITVTVDATKKTVTGLTVNAFTLTNFAYFARHKDNPKDSSYKTAYDAESNKYHFNVTGLKMTYVPDIELTPSPAPTDDPNATARPKAAEPVNSAAEITLDRTSYPLYTGVSNRNSFADWQTSGSSVVLTASLNSSYGENDIAWSVDDESIVTLTASGDKATVKAIRTGFATVTASLPNGSSASASISVIDIAARLTTGRIELNTDTLTLSEGQSARLKPILYPKDIYSLGMLDASISWQSSDTSVATVEDGVVTAVGTGTAAITAVSADNGRTTQCAVSVSEAPSGENTIIDFDGSSVTVNIKDVDALLYTAAYENIGDVQSERFRYAQKYTFDSEGIHTIALTKKADKAFLWSSELEPYDMKKAASEHTALAISGDGAMNVGETKKLTVNTDKPVKWVSDNSYIADVDSEGNVTAYSNSNVQKVTEDGLYVSEEAGTVKIYATASDGETAEFELTVSDAPVSASKVTVNKDRIAMPSGASGSLTAVVSPSRVLDKNIEWSSSDESIVSVSNAADTVYGAAQANITARSAGTAVITAASGGATDSCIVTVTAGEVKIGSVSMESEKEIDIDEVYRFAPVITQNASNEKLYWICTDKNIATLDREGNVMGYKPGTVKVYAVAEDSINNADAVRSLADARTAGEADIEAALAGAVYAKCELTVKDSSPYLRNLHAPREAVTSDSVNLLWNRASVLDSGECKGYVVYKNGTAIAYTEQLGYTVNGLVPEAAYTFRVEAVDSDYGIMASEEISVTTNSAGDTLNVLDFGAKGNGLVTDTFAIQKAIDLCPVGGTVLLPEGYVFYSGALFLKSDMTLRVDGILIGSIDPKDYPNHITKWEGWRKLDQSESEWANSGNSAGIKTNTPPHTSLINIGTYDEGNAGETGPYNAENVIIRGKGQINANGFVLGFNEGPNSTYSKSWTKYNYPVKNATIRGRAVTAQCVDGLYMKDITVAFSPSWTNHLIYDNDVTLDHMQVVSQGNGNGGSGTGVDKAAHIPNGDGVDPESCTNLNMFNTYLATGDDSFTLKSGRNREGNELDKPNAYIRVTDCLTEFALGGYGYGSENAAGCHDVLFQNIKVDTVALNGFWLKTNSARGGISENIQIRDSYVTGASGVIHMNHTYTSDRTNAAASLPVLRYVTVENVIGGANSSGIQAEGLSNDYITDVYIRGGDMNGKPSSITYGKDFYIIDCENTAWSQSNTSNITITSTAKLNDTALRINNNYANAYKIVETDNDNKLIKAYAGTSADEIMAGIMSLLGGTQTYSVNGDKLTVISENGQSTAVYTIDTTTSVPTDSYINSLSITGGGRELLSGFDRNVTGYSVRTTKTVTSVAITPVTNDPAATVRYTVNGNVAADANAIPLNVGINVIDIKVTSSTNEERTYTVTVDSGYIIAEGFSNETGTWGFDNAALCDEDGNNILRLINTNVTGSQSTKTFDSAVSGESKLHIDFDWRSEVEKGRGRNSYFALKDSDDKLIFGMFATGSDKVCYLINDITDYDNKIEDFTNDWYCISLDIDFIAKTISGSITNLDTGSVLKSFENEPFTTGAASLCKLHAYDLYSAASVSIDNVYIKAIR